MASFPLDDRVELLIGGTWTDVTGYVYERDPITITRGRSAEAQTADPSKLSLTLDNRDGRFSPRNPSGAYYGLIGRNTPIRVSLPGPSYLLPNGTGYAQAPDSAALSITGDLDVRVDADLTDWSASNDLIGKAVIAGSQVSWGLFIREGGKPQLYWSTDGVNANIINALSTAPVPTSAGGRLAVRATLDVNNGSGGWTARFYVSDSLGGDWNQLGDDVTDSGTTSVFDGTAPLQVGRIPEFTLAGPIGRVYAAEVRDGIGGTVVADPDFTTQTAGDTSFADDAGNTWTVVSPATLDDRLYRFHGEVASWPATWAVDGVDRYVRVTASGIKRRLTQNAPSLRSTMYRAHTNPELTSTKAYWPCEDGAGATQIASGLPGHPPMQISGAPTLADYSGWTASDAMPTMETGRFSGVVPSYAATGEVFVYFFIFPPFEAISAETSLLKVHTTGTAALWDVRILANGNLRTNAYDAEGFALTDSSTHGLGDEVALDLDTRGFSIQKLQLVQNGADIDWETTIIEFHNAESIGDIASTVGFFDTTLTGETVGRVTKVIVGDEGGLGDTKLSHIVVSDDVDKWLLGVVAAIRAHNGETPIARMTRLCDEEEIALTFVTKGQTGNTVTMGDQLDKTLVDLLQEAADSDGGLLYEPRDALGFAYRTRLSMYNQAAALTLDYSDRQVAGDLVPVDDDRSTVNDLTVKRADGSSVHVEQTTGPLSTQSPPDGVGRYNGEVTLSLEDDDQLADQAGWRLHLGTVDEARFPTLTVNLRTGGVTDELAAQALALDVGDRIVLTGIPEGLPREDASLLVQGYTETLRLMEYVITLNLAPESPWHVGQVETTGYDRVDHSASSLASDATSTATSLSVASSDGTLWTTDSGDMPFDVLVAGERVTVSAVSGTSSPQTFTVTRSVNGVEKAQTTGAEVRLPEPVYVAL